MIAEFVSLTSPAGHAVIPADHIAHLLRTPSGMSMTRLVSELRHPRDLLSHDLETMRDYLGYPVQWNPASGNYYIGGRQQEERIRPEGVLRPCLAQTRDCLEENHRPCRRTGCTKCLHALPRRARKVNGKAQVKLVERSGAWRVIALEAIREVQEAFGMNK